MVSQLIKIFVEWKGAGKLDGKDVLALSMKSRSGGMPSGHTASFVALAMYLGFFEGFDSGIFALAVGVTVIVVYDALNVRRSVGEIGQVMEKAGKVKRVVKGHSVPEIIAGALVGVAVGWGVWSMVG